MTGRRTALSVLLIVLFPGVFGCEIERREETFEIREVHGTIDRLTVRTGAGNIEVFAEETDVITVDTIIYGEETEIDQSIRGSELVLETNCDHQSWHCSVDYRISVPGYLAARLDSGSGDLFVAGIAGDALGETGSGNVEVHCLLSEVVDIETGSGEVRGTGLLSESVSVSSGSGDIDLDFVGAPEAVLADTGSGDIDLEVPAGDGYAIETDTGSGDVRITGVQCDNSAARTLRATSGSGDITITGR